MKRIPYVIVALMGISCTALGQEKGLGVGVIFGEPTGISAKGWVSDRGAIDGGLAWSFRNDGYINVYMDYLWHFSDIVNNNNQQSIIPYLGIGGRIVGDRGSGVAGVRIAGGLSWLPAGAPLDVYLEFAPILDLAPETQFNANGGLGIRFYFR